MGNGKGKFKPFILQCNIFIRMHTHCSKDFKFTAAWVACKIKNAMFDFSLFVSSSVGGASKGHFRPQKQSWGDLNLKAV